MGFLLGGLGRRYPFFDVKVGLVHVGGYAGDADLGGEFEGGGGGEEFSNHFVYGFCILSVN